MEVSTVLLFLLERAEETRFDDLRVGGSWRWSPACVKAVGQIDEKEQEKEVKRGRPQGEYARG